MFRGRYEYSIDAKGRLNIPAKVRELLVQEYTPSLMVTNGFDGCLDCFPYPEWTCLEDKVSLLPQNKKEVKSFHRFYLSAAVECALDKQGRILVPPSLRGYAQLEKEVVIVCAVKKIEIWSKERWEVELADTLGAAGEISAAMAEFGI